jgi:DNA processing protein
MEHSSWRDHLIALSLLPFLSPSRIRLLLEYFEPLEKLASAPIALLQGLFSVPPELAALVKNPLTAELRAQTERLRDDAVTWIDSDYPPRLRETPDPPLVLHCRGNKALLALPSLAVVGSRRASAYAVNAAAHLVRDLAGSGMTIVSGLARGVDAAAHETALDCGIPTIGVLGTGIDIVYPRSNGRLFRNMERAGLIVTEFPPGTPPRAENFPIRNRIIAGLSLGSVIVEATARSGSLITARLAAEQGREVFAVPGSIFSAGSEGTHRLIQYGAKLVHDAQDILDELPGEFRRRIVQSEPEPDGAAGQVLTLLSKDAASHIDWLRDQSGRPHDQLAESLLQLELDGWIRAMPGARYLRVR